MTEQRQLLDGLGRPLRDLRISVTDRCNFRCSYCMPKEIFGPDFEFIKKNLLLSFGEMDRLVHIFASVAGVKKIRLTGGEPLMRPNIHLLVEKLMKVEGIEDIAMTTNGSLLPKYAKKLSDAGLKRVTVSLDTLDSEKFGEINGRGVSVQTVLNGMEAAADAGMQVKVNMVVKRGLNEEDILPMAKFFKEKGYILRFIEYMDVGNSNGWRLDEVFTKQEIIDTINKELPIEPIAPNYKGEVATRYRYVGTDQEIGIISSVTDAFCSTCNRARLSAEGKLFTCLFASNGFDFRALLRSEKSDEEIAAQVAKIWSGRKDRYSEERLSNTNLLKNRKKVEMSHIGG